LPASQEPAEPYVATKFQFSTAVWRNWPDKTLQGSTRKLRRTPLKTEHHRRPSSPSPTADRAASPSTTSCGPFLPSQVSKMDPLCRLDYVGSITPRNRVTWGKTWPPLPSAMAPPCRSPVFIDWKKVVRYGPLDHRWMDKIRSRNNLSFLIKSELSRAKSMPQINLGFSFVK
jgi:hypothetical protein